MLLTIDIGNTNVYVVLWSNDEKICSFRFTTFQNATSDEMLLRLSNFLSFYNIDIASIHNSMLANVVPQLRDVFKDALKLMGVDKILFVADTLTQSKLPISVDNKDEVGEDRIANAYAARTFFADENVIVVDMGTATTYDIVLNDKGYVGGVITPGINLAIESLTKATSQLPKIALEKPKSVCGQNTISAINSGIYYGCIGQVNNIVKSIIEEKGREFRVISTGGLGEIILSSCKVITGYDPDLTIKGLKKIFEDN